MAEEEIKNPVVEIMKVKTKDLSELINNYKKLHDYIKPFLQSVPEMSKLAHHIEIQLAVLPLLDITLITAMSAQNLAFEMIRPKIPFKVECPDCKKTVYDFSEVEKEFEKRFKDKKVGG